MGIFNEAHLVNAGRSRKLAQQQVRTLQDTQQQQAAGQHALAGLLQQMIAEQQVTNRLLWAAMSDEQRAAFEA